MSGRGQSQVQAVTQLMTECVRKCLADSTLADTPTQEIPVGDEYDVPRSLCHSGPVGCLREVVSYYHVSE